METESAQSKYITYTIPIQTPEYNAPDLMMKDEVKSNKIRRVYLRPPAQYNICYDVIS